MTIAKIHQNSSARATLGYVLTKPGASVIGGNAADWVACDALTEVQRDVLLEDAIALFDLADALNPIKQPVYHIALSLPPHETLNDESFSELSDQYLAGLILSAEQPDLLKQCDDAQLAAAIERFRQEELPKYFYVIVRHTDVPHPHVHLVVAKINLETTKAIPTSFDRYRSQSVLRSLERQHGLSVQANSWEVDRKAESTQQAQAEIKTGQPSVHKRLQAILDEAAAHSQTVPAFIEQAQARGVEVQMQFTRTGKSKGISYSLDGVSFSGHALGTRYSFKEGDPGLVRHLGLSYEPERDRVIIQTLCQRPVVSEMSPPMASPDAAHTLVLDHQRQRALALQRQAEVIEDEDERQAQAAALAPLSGETDSVPIAAIDPPPIAPLSPPEALRSDAALELLPVVAEACQPPMPLPTEVVLDAAATESMADEPELEQPQVLSQDWTTDLPPTLLLPTVPSAQTAHETKTIAPLPTPALTASEQGSEGSPFSIATEPALLPVMVDQVPLLPVEPDDLEPLTLQPERVAEQRHAWGLDIIKIAHLGLLVVGQTRAESGDMRGQTVLDDDHIYQLEWRQSDQTLMVKATDGRGVLVEKQGATITLSDTFTETDWHCFQQQELHFLTLQTLKTQPYRESWGREIAAVVKLALAVANKTEYEGPDYRFAYDGEKLTLEAMNGRGVLVTLQGDQLWVSEQLTQADRDYFQAQLQSLQTLQQQQQQPVKTPLKVAKSKGVNLGR